MKTEGWNLHSIMANRLRLRLKEEGIKGGCRPHGGGDGSILFELRTELFRVRIDFSAKRMRTKLIIKGSSNDAAHINIANFISGEMFDPKWDPEEIITKVISTMQLISEFEKKLSSLHNICRFGSKLKSSNWHWDDVNSDGSGHHQWEIL